MSLVFLPCSSFLFEAIASRVNAESGGGNQTRSVFALSERARNDSVVGELNREAARRFKTPPGPPIDEAEITPGTAPAVTGVFLL